MPLVQRILKFFALTVLVTVNVRLLASEPKETWWSLRPLSRPAVPQISMGGREGNVIDSFLLARLKSSDLGYSPEASRQTLIRRVYFDLVGLPPTPEAVERFVRDPDPRAYERLVDHLLDSPQYGERWARHWLDVVHYGDTQGYDKDKPRPNAWPYRDYVIRSFNEDRPYAHFVQEQIAGDVLFPYTRDGIEALGFISAGPWDFIGHAEVPETKTDGKIARHLDRDDMVANTMNTFNSLTVQCAQCHNHKFDPIPTEDYYKLQAVFAAVDRTDREYYDDPELNRKRFELSSRQRRLETEKKAVEENISSEAGPELAELKKKIEAARKPSSDAKRPPEFGYHSAIEPREDAVKWVQIDLGKPVPLEKIVLHPASDDFGGIGDGFGFPRRFKVEISTRGDFSEAELVLDKSTADQPNPGIQAQTITLGNKTARTIRVTATKLAPRQGDYIFALAELEAIDPEGKNVARGAVVTALDSIEAPVRWAKANLVDGVYPGISAKSSPADIAALESSLTNLFLAKISEETRTRWSTTTNQLSSIQRELSAMPKPMLAFVGAVHYGSGAFRGTGPDGAKPRKICILPRGDVRHPGKEVGPGALSAIGDMPSEFNLPAEAPESERRKALALWLTDSRNPLTWRSIVNRVWQYHFGRGIVGTPNDFGRMGEQPSHPDLLDWLAVEFRDSGQSFKKLHKLILTSAAYRQVSSVTAEMAHAVEIDSENRLLWRANRRKLEAEAVRDSVLFVSGQLDPHMYGPGFEDFVVEKPEHSPHYEYEKFDPDDPRARRRSIYRFIVRSQQQPFMTTLDCADPSMLVAKRNESVSPLQALALLNNAFMLTMAERFADQLQARDKEIDGQVRHAFSTALSRAPSETELRELTDFGRKDGLPNVCRLLFNLNEFNFVD
jgi:hypothetical protein